MSKLIPTTDNFETEINKKIERLQSLADAWKKVTRNHTKDGKDFKIMSKNFSGCKFVEYPYSIRDGHKEKEITVYTRSKYYGYINDSFKDTSIFVNGIAPERIIKETCLVPYYVLTADEIETEINKKIEYYENEINSLSDQKQRAKKALAAYKVGFSKLLSDLESNVGGQNWLYHEIIDSVNKYNAKH